MIRAAAMLVAILGISLISCSSETARRQDLGSQQSSETALQDGSGQFPTSLPQDGVQPWESLDADGFVVLAERAASSININTEFTPGVERFLDSGDAADNLEAVRLNGNDGNSLSQAMYRISMAASQPGIVSVDANLLSGKGYYVGLSNYGTGRWDWQGPFTDNHVRLQAVTDSSVDLTSALGNTFISVLCPAGTSADVVGIGVNQYDPSSVTPPPTPIALTANPVPGGIELSWFPVLDPDLAGYAIYFSDSDFTDTSAAGVERLNYLEGSTRHLLAGLSGQTFAAVTAVDFAGNESSPSTVAFATPLAAAPVPLQLTADAPSTGINGAVQLSATGADSYDWDLDGDGVFEIEDDSTGSRNANTSATGLIRPRVRGRDAGGEHVALGGLSLIVTANSRPVASAGASPQSGTAPLDVTFIGLAEDQEDIVEDLSIAWDFDGDGIYEPDADTLNPAPQNYGTPGLYNARLRVTDTDGAWDVDTVSVLAQPEAANLPPVAALGVFRDDEGDLPFTAAFDAGNSMDLDGTIVSFEWDWESDGIYDEDTGTDFQVEHVFTKAGVHRVSVRVTDDDGASSLASRSVLARGWRSDTVDSTSDTGRYTSMKLVDGLPAISYSGANGLYFVRALDELGRNWGTPVAVDTSGNLNSYGSMEIVAGNPAISYTITGSDTLRYVRATDSLGSSWGTPVDIESGTYSSLEVVVGNPAICYIGGGNLKYVRATNAQGTAWGSPVAVDNSAANQSYTTLLVVAGNPAVGYRGDASVLFVRSSDSQGTTWGAPVIADADGNTGINCSMAIVNGRPAMCYYEFDSTDLRYVRAANNTGTGWGGYVTAAGTGNTGSFCSLAVIDGFPAASYLHNTATSTQLRYVRATDATGTAWGTEEVADSTAGVGEDTSLIFINGSPAISYRDVSNGQLKFAYLYQ
ncbi:MAG: PKD domain-containing protein [bacterium]